MEKVNYIEMVKAIQEEISRLNSEKKEIDTKIQHLEHSLWALNALVETTK